jgi:phosphatidylglycerophosphatase A
MPGTVGTLLGIPLVLALARIDSPFAQSAAIVLIAAAAVPICTAAARQLGASKDPGAIVLDEIVSLPIVFFLVPRDLVETVWVLVVGFVLHRFFDIVKLFPCRTLERLPEGLGIVADDVMAAVYGCLALHLVVNLAA